MATTAHISSGLTRRIVRLLVLLAVATSATSTCAASISQPRSTHTASVRVWTIHYSAHNGRDRLAYVVLPAWYGPTNNPPIPLVISPHGRGATGLSNSKFWGNLPAIGRFAVVNPDGMGRRLKRFSYGNVGQIDDLAKMPAFVSHALPWLRIDRSRIFALGSSMGGQETLLLVARHPRLLAAAAAMDSVTDLKRRYRQLPRLGQHGLDLQSVLRREVGGRPDTSARAYGARSPLSLARRIAFSGVPLQVWWSKDDKIVFDQAHQSAALYKELRRLNPAASLTSYEGRWRHSHEMRSTELLPLALMDFGLLPRDTMRVPASVARATTV